MRASTIIFTKLVGMWDSPNWNSDGTWDGQGSGHDYWGTVRLAEWSCDFILRGIVIQESCDFHSCDFILRGIVIQESHFLVRLPLCADVAPVAWPSEQRRWWSHAQRR